MENSALQLILEAGLVVKLVLLVLLFFSVVSWAIIFFKHQHLKKANRETSEFMSSFRSSRTPERLYGTVKRHTLSPISNIFRAIYSEDDYRDKAEVRRAIRRYAALEVAKLENHLGFLATTGSTTPFIGLFGTVWGIMNSFRSIGETGSASLAVVAPGIAEALIATAMGLVAAIPAVIAYNYFLGSTRTMIVQMDDFSEEILDMVSRGQDEN